jgi:molybdopterin synthase sulfur carrier subunit
VATVHIPTALRELASGQATLAIDGHTVGEIIDRLDERFPGLRARLITDGAMRPGLQVFVDGTHRRGGLRESVDPTSEIHFLQSISGGAANPVKVVGSVA